MKDNLPELLYEFSEFYDKFFENGNPYLHLPINATFECIIEFLESKEISMNKSFQNFMLRKVNSKPLTKF